MFYFAHQQLDIDSQELTEEAIRSFSLKRHTSLDFKTISLAGKDDKYFLGLEGVQDLKITRIRTSFERFLPQLIISFPKEELFIGYRVRYSFFSTVFLVILIWGLSVSFYELFEEEKSSMHVIQMTSLCVAFIGLTILEMALVKRKILKAIECTTRIKRGRTEGLL